MAQGRRIWRDISLGEGFEVRRGNSIGDMASGCYIAGFDLLYKIVFS